MDSRAATELQIAGYREMTGEQRVALSLELHELACDVTRAGIRAQFPAADEQEVEQRLRDRIRLSHLRADLRFRRPIDD